MFDEEGLQRIWMLANEWGFFERGMSRGRDPNANAVGDFYFRMGY